MKKLVVVGVVWIMVVSFVANVEAVEIFYGDYTLADDGDSVVFDDTFDLTECDITVSYIIDMNYLTQDDLYDSPYIMVGLMDSETGIGWMNSELLDIAPSPDAESSHERHALGTDDNYGPLHYNAIDPDTVTTDIGTYVSYGINFDRDSTRSWVMDAWGQFDGATYNTGGIYEIEITFHAINDTLGTMFAKINGVEQGFWDSWSSKDSGNEPDVYPAGKSFTGDMKNVSAFIYYDECEEGDMGYVEFKDVRIESECGGTGEECEVEIDIKPGSYPSSVNPCRNGAVPVAIFSNDCFDATTILPETVICAGAGVKVKCDGNYMYSFEDKNDDGVPDMVVHIIAQDIDLSTIIDGFTELYAVTSNDEEITAVGDINIVNGNCYRRTNRHVCHRHSWTRPRHGYHGCFRPIIKRGFSCHGFWKFNWMKSWKNRWNDHRRDRSDSCGNSWNFRRHRCSRR